MNWKWVVANPMRLAKPPQQAPSPVRLIRKPTPTLILAAVADQLSSGYPPHPLRLLVWVFHFPHPPMRLVRPAVPDDVREGQVPIKLGHSADEFLRGQ
jgi:hypothetical protein